MDYLSFIFRSSDSSGGGVSFLTIAMYIAMIVAWWFLFEKAGKPGWLSLIPLVNVWILFDIVYGAGWKSLLLFVPVLNFVVLIAFWIRLAQAYDQGPLFGIGLIFLPNIFLLILAFSGARYRGAMNASFL